MLTILSMALVLYSQADQQLSLQYPERVHELQLIWVTVSYPMPPVEMRKWTRPNLSGNRNWPAARVSLQGPAGSTPLAGGEAIIDPGQELARYAAGAPKQGWPRSGESFPLQLVTGPLNPGKYKMKVEIVLDPMPDATGPVQKTSTSLRCDAEFEVVAATPQERTRALDEARKALQANAGESRSPTARLDQLAPLVLEGSEDSLLAIARVDGASGRAVADLMHLRLMREPDRQLAVRVALGLLRRPQAHNPLFHDISMKVLYYRATSADLPAILDLMDHAADKSGRDAAMAVAARVSKFSDIRWSPTPSAVASQIPDYPSFRARVQKVAELAAPPEAEAPPR